MSVREMVKSKIYILLNAYKIYILFMEIHQPLRNITKMLYLSLVSKTLKA